MTKTFAALSAAALIGLGALAPSDAQARGGGGALAAGIIGGLAAGALLGAAASEAHAAPVYGYGYDDAPPPVAYRPARYVRSYDVEPVYRVRRYEGYDDGPAYGYGYRPVAHRWHRDCDRPGEYGGW